MGREKIFTEQELKEKEKESNKKYYQKNREKRKEYHKQWYINNKEKIHMHQKQYCIENGEKIREYHKQWRKSNPEYHKQWKEYNPEYYKKYYKERRGNKMNLNEKKTEEVGNKLGDILSMLIRSEILLVDLEKLDNIQKIVEDKSKPTRRIWNLKMTSTDKESKNIFEDKLCKFVDNCRKEFSSATFYLKELAEHKSEESKAKALNNLKQYQDK